MNLLPLYRCTALCLALCVVAISRAEIREAKDSLLITRLKRAIASANSEIGTPDLPITKGTALVKVSVAGPSFTFEVVGSNSGDARRYAQTLESWLTGQGGREPVEYSTDEDGTVARASLNAKKLFALSGEKMIELESFFRAVSGVEPNTVVLMTDTTWSHAGFPIPPESRSSAGTGYWNLTKASHPLPPVTGRASISLVQVAMGTAFFLLMPVGALILCLLGYRVLRNGQLSAPQRRKQYSKYVMLGTFALLAVHSVIAVTTLSTRALEPLTQLWFGLRFTQIAIPLFPISAVFGILPFLFITRLEASYLGPTEEEKAEAVARPLREVDVPKGKTTVGRLTSVLQIVCALLLLLSQFAFRGHSGAIDSWTIVVGLAMIYAMTAYRSLGGSYKVTDEERTRSLDRLKSSVERMSGRLDLSAPPCRLVTDVSSGRYNGVLTRKEIGVTINALDEFSDEELDFLVAHELAHKKARHLRLVSLAMMVVLIPVMLGVASILMGKPLGLTSPSFTVTPMLVSVAMTPLILFGLPKLRQKQEFEADRLAVAATRDVNSAVIVLRKLALNNGNVLAMDVASTTHPAMAQRIAAVQEMAGG